MTVVPCGESLAPAHQDTSPLLTAEESWQLRQQPEFADQLLELDEIELVIVSPPGARHGRVGVKLARILDEYIFQLSRGAVFAHDTGLLIHRDPDTVLEPNLIVYTEPRDWEDLPKGWLGENPNFGSRNRFSFRRCRTFGLKSGEISPGRGKHGLGGGTANDASAGALSRN
ncbi:MAG: Uma2 family endonuclease [Gemmatales bacterium]|nr:Uma2 family endonuclease [Gemmatales bacterium]